MIDCTHYRRAMLANPHDADQELRTHLDGAGSLFFSSLEIAPPRALPTSKTLSPAAAGCHVAKMPTSSAANRIKWCARIGASIEYRLQNQITNAAIFENSCSSETWSDGTKRQICDAPIAGPLPGAAASYQSNTGPH